MFGFSKRNNKIIYLDHAATTPVDPIVVQAMAPFWHDNFYNASSLYDQGVAVKKVLESSRTLIASYFLSRMEEVFFTGSGTESNNIAIRGVVDAYKEKGISRPHIITSSIEHPATLEVCKYLEGRGVEVTYIKPNTAGRIDSQDVHNALKAHTVLVSLIHTQNEIGTIQPTKDVERVINQYKKAQGRIESDAPHLHVDASQSPNYIRCTKDKLGAQLITIDGSKIYGPKGVSALYVDRRVPIRPISYGGGQESGLRPGTENIPLIVGLAKALEITESLRESESKRLSDLRDYCVELLKKNIPEASINGSLKHRIPNNISVCIPGMNAEYAVIQLSQKGILCSFMTACRTQGNDLYSYIIQEINSDCKNSSLRITFGRSTRKSDIRFLVNSLAHITQK